MRFNAGCRQNDQSDEWRIILSQVAGDEQSDFKFEMSR